MEWERNVGPKGEKVELALADRFPYGPPEVVLPDRLRHMSWHRNILGILCLWDTHSQGDLPWLTVTSLLDRVFAWIENDDSGWTDDEPALDLEAYHVPYQMHRWACEFDSRHPLQIIVPSQLSFTIAKLFEHPDTRMTRVLMRLP